MLADIQKETVDFGPNYDDSLTEPTVLPAAFPFLLANGSSGIADLLPFSQAPPCSQTNSGAPGAPGVGIASITCDTSTGAWIVTLTDGTVQYPGGTCVAQPAPQESPEPPGQ